MLTNVSASWLECFELKKVQMEFFSQKKKKKSVPLIVEQRALGIQSPWLQSRQPLTENENTIIEMLYA